mmetsp:Transcript_15933/g.47920  ORF Transcript_15933/g.47920 Transcript_15933/m.47920 type:complete len:207 (+) Transcript_15933:2748-3368(+)
MGAGLFAEAGGVAAVLQGQLILLVPALAVHGTDGLLRRGNEVFVLPLPSDLIELLIELRKLCALGHDVLAHEERRLQRREVALVCELQRIADECIVQQHPRPLQEVAPVSCHNYALLEVSDVQALDQVHVIVQFRVGSWLPPGLHHCIVVLVVVHGHTVVHQVSNSLHRVLTGHYRCLLLLFGLHDVRLQSLRLLPQLRDVLLCFA